MIVPAVIGERRRIILPIVDLPLPLSPISETTSPALTSKVTSLTAVSVFPAERADPVVLAARVEPEQLAGGAAHGFPPAGTLPVATVPGCAEPALAVDGGSSSTLRRDLPAGDGVAGLDLDEGRFLAAPAERERAAVPEAATRRRVEQRGRPAGDSRPACFSSYRTPTSGSDEIRSCVYGWSGAWMIVSAGAFSASFPAYMTRIVSAIW